MFGFRSYQYMEEDSSGFWFKECQEKSITHKIIINENEVKAYSFMSFRGLRNMDGHDLENMDCKNILHAFI